MKINLVYEHDGFLIVEKPAGLNFHTEAQAGFVVQCQQQWSEETLFPVHRLDKMTSGLVILAKSKHSAAQFEALFSHHQIEKYYLALSAHKPKKKQGWVKGDMAPARRGSWKLLRSQEHPAITQFISKAVNTQQGHLRAFLLKPHTGRTHQLRVALKSIRSPILGDERYAPAEEVRQCDRGYLHAWALKFNWQGEEVECAVVPTEGEHFQSATFLSCLQDWQNPWEKFK